MTGNASTAETASSVARRRTRVAVSVAASTPTCKFGKSHDTHRGLPLYRFNVEGPSAFCAIRTLVPSSARRDITAGRGRLCVPGECFELVAQLGVGLADGDDLDEVGLGEELFAR